MVRNLLAVVVFLSMVVSCAAPKAREGLGAALGEAWPPARADVDLALERVVGEDAQKLEVETEVEDMDRAVSSGMRSHYDLVDWDLLEKWSKIGIRVRVTEGTIDELVVPSLEERLRQIGDAVKELRTQTLFGN